MVNYPSGQKPRRQSRNQNQINFSGRGMSLEERINQSNLYYLSKGLAVIHKKPTPIQVVQVDYPSRSAAKITEAYYRHASTTDYNGVYQGYYIDFEVKETKNKTSFPLQNIKDHQIKHMQQCLLQKGIVFLIISFKAHNEIYLLPFQELETFRKKHDKQSIPYEYLKEKSYIIPQGLNPSIDYLYAVDLYIADLEALRNQE